MTLFLPRFAAVVAACMLALPAGVAGVEVVGPFPGDLHNVTTFAAR